MSLLHSKILLHEWRGGAYFCTPTILLKWMETLGMGFVPFITMSRGLASVFTMPKSHESLEDHSF